MRFLHTMVRVSNLDESLAFYCGTLGLIEVNRVENEAARFTLVYLCAPMDQHSAQKVAAPTLELTHNWDSERYIGGRNFGHLAYEVDDLYVCCQKLLFEGVAIRRPPRDGHMAFIRSPDGISIELLQKGEPLAPAEPWISMVNCGAW